MILPNEKVVIVGAGCFGVSTAYHLLKRGFTDVSIIERSEVLPATDAASNDLNRIVRSSYSDRFYAELGREAIRTWKNREEWGDTYHESGLVITVEESGKAYVDESYKNDVALGARVKELNGGPDAVNTVAIRSVFPETVHVASFAKKQKGYINYDCGWADAGQGLSLMIRKVEALGGRFVTGKTFSGLVRNDKKNGGHTVGVECVDGSTYEAALVILALGAWTPFVLPDLELKKRCLATGQSVAMVQLTAEEAASYKDCPVLLDLSTGFYIFPPTKEHVVKFAMHKFGYTHRVAINGYTTKISTPRTAATDPVRGLCIPKGDLQLLRSYLREIYPDLAEKPFMGTRLCWYIDSPGADWIIGRYPGDNGLMLATGGSGHAYKFLPVIGQVVADVVQDKLGAELVKKFAVNRPYDGSTDGSRSGGPSELRLDELCTAEDLSAVNA